MTKQILINVTIVTIAACATISGENAIAQINPDASLGSESSSINPGGASVNGTPADLIEGGARRGENLFHSFSDFNVNNGQQVYFANPTGIARIIGRVTGSDPSNILGTLGALGNADLFLLNPNGIFFGPQSRLDVNGSFFASTADSLIFDRGFAFSASDPQAPPLLTITSPVGLQFGQNPGTIVNRSISTDSSGQIVGLQVKPGQTLGLVGGEISLEGGYLSAPQGQIELGGVGDRALVSLDMTNTLGYENARDFQNIQLSQQANIDASGDGGGAIHMRGDRILVTDNSQILADTLGNSNGRGIAIEAANLRVEKGSFISVATFGSGSGGDLTIRTSESTELIGNGFERFQQLYVLSSAVGLLRLADRENGLFSGTAGSGEAGDITIETGRLLLQNGAAIVANVFDSGNGTDLTINASDAIELDRSAIILTSNFGGSGGAGTIAIDTKYLTIQDGGFIVSGSSLSAGDAGTIDINASESVIVQRTPETAFVATSIGSISLAGATGSGGDLSIETKELIVRGGGAIGTNSGVISRGGRLESAGAPAGDLTIKASERVEISGTSTDGFFSSRIISETLSAGSAGRIEIDTKHLLVSDGGQISATTTGDGQGGEVIVRASESIALIGDRHGEGNVTGVFAASGDPSFGIAGTGAGGNLKLDTGELTIQNGAVVEVNGFGVGDAGNIEIIADAIRLENLGEIGASTASGEGGNINLQVRDSLIMRDRGFISARAGGTGNGGNIEIAGNFIVTAPQENSDIVANAIRGRGGNINITAQGLFGFAAQASLTPFSDIDASSAFGLDGVVQISSPDIDPSRTIVQLPEVPGVPEPLEGCPAGDERSNSFVVLGQGGLPSNPTKPLSGSIIWEDLRLPAPENEHLSEPNRDRVSSIDNRDRIVEAQEWSVNERGQIVLSAGISTQPNIGCQLTRSVINNK